MATSPVMAFTICTLGEASNQVIRGHTHLIRDCHFSDQIEDSAHEILLSSSVTPIVTFNSVKVGRLKNFKCFSIIYGR